MLWWNENVVESVQKCENMGCVVWSKVGMTVEDTMHIGDGSAHCDVPTTVGLMWDCINIHFQYSLKTKNRNQSKWCYSIQYTGKQCCLYTYILLPILYLDPHLFLWVPLKMQLIKLFHSDVVSLENVTQCGQTDSLNVVEYGVVLDHNLISLFTKIKFKWQLPVPQWTSGPFLYHGCVSQSFGKTRTKTKYRAWTMQPKDVSPTVEWLYRKLVQFIFDISHSWSKQVSPNWWHYDMGCTT